MSKLIFYWDLNTNVFLASFHASLQIFSLTWHKCFFMSTFFIKLCLAEFRIDDYIWTNPRLKYFLFSFFLNFGKVRILTHFIIPCCHINWLCVSHRVRHKLNLEQIAPEKMESGPTGHVECSAWISISAPEPLKSVKLKTNFHLIVLSTTHTGTNLRICERKNLQKGQHITMRP